MQEKNKDFSVLKQRLLQFLDYKGISKKECYSITGISDGVLSQTNGLSEDNLLKFLSFFPEINVDWLMKGVGEMVNPTKNKGALSLIDDDNIGTIPVYYNIAVAAGQGLYNQEPEIPDNVITLPSHLLKRGNQYICVQTRGESMAPTIHDSSFIIARHLERAEWGEMPDEHVYIVVSMCGEAYLKRIKNRLTQGFIVLTSDSPQSYMYPSFNLKEDEIQHLWHAEWNISARMPNVHAQFYDRLKNLEDRFDAFERIHA